jgi:hypothetical protein
MEGLAPVISAKARRLERPRPKMGKGYYRGPPGKPIVVPVGMGERTTDPLGESVGSVCR